MFLRAIVALIVVVTWAPTSFGGYFMGRWSYEFAERMPILAVDSGATPILVVDTATVQRAEAIKARAEVLAILETTRPKSVAETFEEELRVAARLDAQRNAQTQKLTPR